MSRCHVGAVGRKDRGQGCAHELCNIVGEVVVWEVAEVDARHDVDLNVSTR